MTAWEDIKNLHPEQLSKKLGLCKNSEATMPLDTSDFVVLKFKFREQADVLASPVETPWKPRAYGFLPGGRTTGGAREWLIDSDAQLKGQIEFIE